jgi:chromosome partitioning protein
MLGPSVQPPPALPDRHPEKVILRRAKADPQDGDCAVQNPRLILTGGAPEMPAKTIVALNQKGGVGKTSTTYHLSGTLAKDGLRVLAVDVDPQASLTQGFEGPNFMRALPRHASIAALFGDDLVPAPDDLIRPTKFANVWLVPGSGYLTRHNIPEPHEAPPDQQRALCDFVAEVRDRFDLILLDCPPNLHLCSWAALVASDYLITPLQAEDFGSQGVAAILDCVEAVLHGANPRLHLLGFLLTLFNPRLGIHKAYEAMLRELYGPLVFETTIPIGTDFKEAIAQRKPIVEHRPRGASAKAIKALADELLARIAAAESGDQDRSRRVA